MYLRLMVKAFIFLLVIGAFMGTSAFAQNAAFQNVSLDITNPSFEALTLKSEVNNSNYKIFISKPESYYSNTNKDFPVLYVLDANGLFTLMTQIYDLLRLSNEIPEMIIVGIGYDVPTFSDSFALRVTDLTPSKVSEEERILESHFRTNVVSGGAAGFLNLITGQIVPLIDENYRTNRTRVLAGFSLGGLFSTYAMLHSNGIFTHYLIGSPSLWWDEGVIFSHEKEYANRNTTLDAKVFMSVGSLEEDLMVTPVKYLAHALTGRNYKGFEFHTHVFENERHFTVIPATLSRGLRILVSQHDVP